MKIKISYSAYKDIDAAQLFYESQKAGLGIYFQDSIFSDIDSLHIYAGVHLTQYGKYRLLSKKFPYAIYYYINVGEIVISAVLDCRRNPDLIKNKLR